MNVQSAFSTFLQNLRVDSPEEISKRYKRITKLLNRKYWDSESDTLHSLQVGSYGRGTAAGQVSDLDMVMALPWTTKKRFDNYEGNGQSALLQEVKGAISASYPSTEISGNGQVVVIELENFTIEVLPAFENDDGSYVFADTHDDGSWKTTKPRAEISVLDALNKTSGGNLKHLCKMTRAWRSKSGATMGGLLIDTLCFNFMEERTAWHAVGFGSFDGLVCAFFDFLRSQDPEQSYWLAPGSRQQVEPGSFVRKAAAAYHQAKDALAQRDKARCADLWCDIFGRKFPTPVQLGDVAALAKTAFRDTEEFIEDQVPVAIRYRLEIDCDVMQDGFRTHSLVEMLKKRWLLKRGKKLAFFVKRNLVPPPFVIKWKVRNVGPKAESKDQIRGGIHVDGGRSRREEHSLFHGPHYVECYVIKGGLCVARDRIDVPIDEAD